MCINSSLLKKFFCLLLVMCVVSPSYADLATSDNSAFVTKEEFDNALNDFNERLTIFESGINSKIDSQVSSYLDRNGIWSGKQQELKNKNVNGFGFPAITLASNKGSCNSDLKSTLIVEKVDKSGFAVVKWSMISSNTSKAMNLQRLGYLFYLTYDTKSNMDCGMIATAIFYKVVDGTTTNLNSVTLISSLGQKANIGTSKFCLCTLSAPQTKLIFVTSFFVTKNEPLYFKINVNAHFIDCSSVSTDNQVNLNFNFDDITVY